MKWLSLIILGGIMLVQCKSNVEDTGFIENQHIIHGVNDQIIDGQFLAKNKLGIQHSITIHKIENNSFSVILSSENSNKKLNYSITSKGSFNGYAMLVPIEYNKKSSTIFLNFNSNNLELSFENDAENTMKDIGIIDNNLPKVYQHVAK